MSSLAQEAERHRVDEERALAREADDAALRRHVEQLAQVQVVDFSS